MAAPININANLNLNPASINASAKQVQQALGRITGQASEFQKSLDASTARVFAFGATTAVINGVTQTFKKLVTTTIDVQARLIEINSILGTGASEFNKYRNAIFKVAKETGQSFTTVAEGAAELARQGLSATDSAKRLKAALILTRISGLGAQDSVKALTAAMNGFTSAGLSANQIVNKIVAVDTAFAVSAQDLAQGFSRAGSTAEDAGVSFEELLAIITAVEQRTARGGAVIGNALKSIFTRISRGDTIGQLQELGVAISAGQSGIQKLQALSKALDNIADPTIASQIKELAGGVFQINVVSAALKDLGSDASIFGQATKTAFDATNEATEKNKLLNESLLSQINELTVSLTSFADRLGGLTISPILENVVGLASALTNALDSALDPEKGNKFVQGLFKFIGGFLAGPGLAIFTGGFIKIFGTVLKFAKEGFKTVLQMGSAAEKLKQIEGGMVSLLQRDAALRKTLENSSISRVAKEKAIVDAIKRENALLSSQQQLVTNIATIARSAGVTSFSSSTGAFKGKKGKRFASGGNGTMEPDLMTAMVNEARDAPAGASPYVTNFRGSPAVMNTSEMQVKIGGREEILTAGQIPRFAKTSVKGGKKSKKDGTINPMGFAYLVPQVGVKGQFKDGTYNEQPFKGSVNVYGPKKTEIKGNSDLSENYLGERVGDSIFKSASDWTQKLSPLGRQAKPKEIETGFKQTKGAQGALKAAIGSAFEVGIASSLDYTAAAREKGGDFDVRGGTNLARIKQLFGMTEDVGDFKVSQSRGNRESFYAKIAKERMDRGKSVSDGGMSKNASKNENKTVVEKRIASIDKIDNPKDYVSGTNTLKKGVDRGVFKKRTAGLRDKLMAAQKAKIPSLSKGTISNSRLASKTGIRRFSKGSSSPKGGSTFSEMVRGLDASNKASMAAASTEKERARATIKANSATLKLAQTYGKSADEVKKQITAERTKMANEKEFAKKPSAMSRAGSTIKGSFGKGKETLMKGGMGGIGASFGLSMIGSGLNMASAELEKSSQDASSELGRKTMVATAAATSIAGDMTSFAATGAMIGGPIGAAVGAAAGLGLAFFKSAKAEKELEKKIEANNKSVAKRIQSVNASQDDFTRIMGKDSTVKGVSNDLSQIAKSTGREEFNFGGTLERMSASFDKVEKGSEEYVKLSNRYNALLEAANVALSDPTLKAFGATMRRLNRTISERLENSTATRQAKKIGAVKQSQDVRSSLLMSSLSGPIAELMRDQNKIEESFISTSSQQNQMDQLRMQRAATTDPSEIKEITKKIDEGAKKFRETILQSGKMMGQMLLTNEKKKAELIKQRDEAQSGAKGSRFETLLGALNQRTDMNFVRGAAGDVNRAIRSGNLEEQRKAFVDFDEMVLAKALTPEMKKMFVGMLDLTDKNTRKIFGASVMGETPEERSNLYASTSAGQSQKGIGAINKNLADLDSSTKAIKGKLKEFGEAFNQPNMKENVLGLVTSVTNLTTGVASFEKLSKAMSGTSSKIATIIKQGEAGIEKDIKIMESLAEQRKATQAVLDKTLLKMQEIEKQVADMTG